MKLDIHLNGDSPRPYPESSGMAMEARQAGVPRMPRTHILDQALHYAERVLMAYAIYRVVTSEDGFKDLVKSRF